MRRSRRLPTLPAPQVAPEPSPASAPAGASPASPVSGVVCKDELDAWEAADAPPWGVVRAYLDRGEQRAWVEGHAARSPAFAQVLAALRNDAEERDAGARVVPLRRR